VARKAVRQKKLRVEQMKPLRFRHYLTLGELAQVVGRDKDHIRRLEREGRIPEGIRHKIGNMELRLYPPARVEEIKRIFSEMKPGRPKKS
jgi:hypothetical protein